MAKYTVLLQGNTKVTVEADSMDYHSDCLYFQKDAKHVAVIPLREVRAAYNDTTAKHEYAKVSAA